MVFGGGKTIWHCHKFCLSSYNDKWFLVNVYGPCQGIMRDEFVNQLYNLQVEPEQKWLLLGDFNFIRSMDNRNLPGGNVNDIFIFNEIIGHLGLLELPLKGRRSTWSSMQDVPLLEQLDYFFYFCQLDKSISHDTSCSSCQNCI